MPSSQRNAPAGAPRRPLAPALKASAALHAGALAATLASPQHWPLALSALALNHAVLLAAGLTPNSRLLGPNLSSLPAAAIARAEVVLSFDDGPDPRNTAMVLELLDAAGARATFFCVGEQILRHPALAREIIARGHTIENHTMTHPVHFGWFGRRRLQRELRDAQHAISDATGHAPRFFRAPFGMRNPLLDPVLARLGLHLVSWTRRGFDTTDADAPRVSARLTARLAAGDILLLHDGIAVRRDSAARQAVLRQSLQAVLATIAARRLRAVTLSAALP